MEAPHYPWMNLRRWLVVCCLFVLGTVSSYATHLRAGNIIVRKVGNDCSNLTYRITVRVYTNTKDTDVLFGGDQDYLDFGDGTPRVLVPEQQNIMIDVQRHIAYAEYSFNHTYGGNGNYTISYIEPNRNRFVLNMLNSGETTFYLETKIRIDPYLGCSTPAILQVDPIDFACPGVAWTHNPGAYDPDGDSISYEMTIPNRDVGQTVDEYRAPNDPFFYNIYDKGEEDGFGEPDFSIDPVVGTITWNAPEAIGEYNIAFNIIEWRKKDGVWYKMGYVRRDMQIRVEDCDNNRPDLIVPRDTCIVAGQTLRAPVFGFDLPPDPPGPQDLDNVKLEAFSQIFENPPTALPVATFFPEGVYGPSTIRSDFEWVTNCNHVRSQPYQVVFKVSDVRGSVTGLATFKTWFITVVAPEPTWASAVLDQAQRQGTLTWDPYSCGKANKMEIWRRVDSVSFKPDNCQTGMPAYLGYEKIDEVPINGDGLNQYLDNNHGKKLAAGAMYCYRLVAVFPTPGGGESYVSRDICIGPILADVPIITHVTVEKTDPAIGQIRVSWKRPFDANKIVFPPPYHYKVNRINDATVVDVNDTTYVDDNVNTEENIYYYSVSAFASNNLFVGTSDTASAVRLDAKSQIKKIELNWKAIVPWSNLLQSTPTENYTHVIYRGPEGSTEIDLVEIASVDATAEGFIYVDTNVEDTKKYCYAVKTRGGYGNPKIDEPLENFSQMICVQPGDSIAPTCKPVLSLKILDCEKYYDSLGTCAVNSVMNELYWSRPTDPACRADISGYNIYRSNVAGGDVFTLIKENGKDTVYRDENLPSLAWCYKISFLDRSGNESELSEEVCNDNCPYYELPNVFSPNGDGYNDKFAAYSNTSRCAENEPCAPVPDESRKKCARFVEKVKFKVFNRWGQEVYTYQSGGDGSEKTIYIDWDGRDNTGSQLTPAVYYYVAEVTFDVLRPSDRVRTYKGWVHLLDDPE